MAGPLHWQTKTQEQRFLNHMSERGMEEFTRTEFIELLLHTVKDEIWGMSDGDIEDLADQFGMEVESFKHGTFFVKNTLDNDDN